MKNAYYIDKSQKGKTLKILGRICDAKVRMKRIQSILDQELKETKELLSYLKETIND